MGNQDDSGFNENDIRPSDLMANKLKYVDADRNFLLAAKARWVDVDCPACGDADRETFGAKAGFSYGRCGRCGTVYTSPRPTPELLSSFYAQSENYRVWNEVIFPATEPVRRERIFRPRAQRVVQLLDDLELEPRSLLEIGAAFGTFLDEIRKLGRFDELLALEPTPDLAATLRSRGFEVFESMIENLKEVAIVDAIAAFEVIEHLFSPQDFIARCARLLRPGGVLILSCPNVRGFDLLTLGVASGTFDHEHLNYFHPESLSMLLTRSGFDVLRVQTPGELDVDLVVNAARSGAVQVAPRSFLGEIVRRADVLGPPFQDFLKENLMSGHMWIAARLRDESIDAQ